LARLRLAGLALSLLLLLLLLLLSLSLLLPGALALLCCLPAGALLTDFVCLLLLTCS
jgi:hypothetical protein